MMNSEKASEVVSPEMRSLIASVAFANPGVGTKKFKKLLQGYALATEISTKTLREELNNIKHQSSENNVAGNFPVDCQPETHNGLKEDQKLGHQVEPAMETMRPEEILHFVISKVVKNPLYLRNLIAKTQVMGGRFGDWSLNRYDVLRKAQRHPLFGQGNELNTPPASCKLAGTIVRILAAKLDQASIEMAANSYAQTMGAYDGLAQERPNPGHLMTEIANVEKRLMEMDKESVSACVSCSLTDLYVMRNPFTRASFAHTFVINLFSTQEGIKARVYQAFGPPDIGYSFRFCLERGSGSKDMNTGEWTKFKADLDAFTRSSSWTNEVEKTYQRLFGCKLKMPVNYPVEAFTNCHLDWVQGKHVLQIMDILCCDYVG